MDQQLIPPNPAYRTETFGINSSELERMEVWLNDRAREGYAVVDRLSQRAVGGARQVNVLMRLDGSPAIAPEEGE